MERFQALLLAGISLLSPHLLLSQLTLSQNTMGQPEGLKQFLECAVLAARSNDKKQLTNLVKKTEIPVPKNWASNAQGAQPAKGSIADYLANLKADQGALERMLMYFARRSGAFFIRIATDSPPRKHLEWELLTARGKNEDVYSVEWKPTSVPEAGSGEASDYLVGYFMFVTEESRWGRLGMPRSSSYLSIPSSLMQICGTNVSRPCATQPKATYAPDPGFSDSARKNKIQGNVRLEFTVRADGHVEDVGVVQFLGYDLEKNAIHAVEQWKFEPAIYNGSAVPVRLFVELTFRLY